MKIYTKKGDRGRTSVFNIKLGDRGRISKSSQVLKAVGSIDEVNSYLGMICSRCEEKHLVKRINSVQRDLLTIGSILAGSKLRFYKSKIVNLEKEIDDLQEKLPALKNFIVPGGSLLAAQLHFVRALVRKAEREVVAFSKRVKVKPPLITYLNRLSDYFFVLARYVNFKLGVDDEVWVGQ